MDAAQMRNLMEHYRNLKGGVEGCKERIQRILFCDGIWTTHTFAPIPPAI